MNLKENSVNIKALKKSAEMVASALKELQTPDRFIESDYATLIKSLEEFSVKFSSDAYKWIATRQYECSCKELTNAQRIQAEKNLIEAAKNNDIVVVCNAISLEINLNARDEDGNTALIWASRKGFTCIAKMLIAAGADVNAKDKAGKTALIWAGNNDFPDIIKILREAGAK